MSDSGERRNWMPDVRMIADQLIAEYRNGEWIVEGYGADGVVYDGFLQAVGTMSSWFDTARAHGQEFTQDDWIALVAELARRAAGVPTPNSKE